MHYSVFWQAIPLSPACSIPLQDCCGVSRMCLSLLSLDFQSAFQANAAVMLILPPGLIIAFQMAFRYIKSGRLQPTRAQNLVLYIMAGFLLLFGILRNLPAFAWLSP